MSAFKVQAHSDGERNCIQQTIFLFLKKTCNKNDKIS